MKAMISRNILLETSGNSALYEPYRRKLWWYFCGTAINANGELVHREFYYAAKPTKKQRRQAMKETKRAASIIYL